MSMDKEDPAPCMSRASLRRACRSKLTRRSRRTGRRRKEHTGGAQAGVHFRSNRSACTRAGSPVVLASDRCSPTPPKPGPTYLSACNGCNGSPPGHNISREAVVHAGEMKASPDEDLVC